ncbi:Gfo/Idh/MocA family oxidoreductase [Streptomyces sp. NPDC052069]|uniref:Gfo/Idh/MocA family protein n=1 Tax=Streptomyces sp. NPDC052069 TaxID=3154650 RepID=UPI0034273F7E
MIRLGLMGCADIALRRMIPAVAATEGIELAAVASRNPDTARFVAQCADAEPVDDYRALLERPDIDAVYIPLPPVMHAEWIGRSLRAGKHVLAEKPLTISYETTSEMVALARASHLVLRENYMFLHHGQHRRVRELLDEGTIGDLRSFSASFAIPARPPQDIRLRPELGGGALFDVCGYPLRAAQLLLGSDLKLLGSGLRLDPRQRVDIGGSALLRRADGVTAQLTFGMDHQYTSEYELVGSAGRISLRHAFTPPVDHRPVLRIERGTCQEELVLQQEDQYAAAVAAFVQDIAGNNTAVDPATVRQAGFIAAIRRTADRSCGCAS